MPQASSDLLSADEYERLELHELSAALPTADHGNLPDAEEHALETVERFREVEASAEQVYAMFQARRDATLGERV
jgi:hypothetical protein